jgi:hypothetical protein
VNTYKNLKKWEIMTTLPWEPTIKFAGEVFSMGEYTPNDGDTCEECRKPLPENYQFLVSTGYNAFCSWECLIKKARKYPAFYKIRDTGAWD